MSEKRILKGNQTIAHAVAQAKVNFIPVFPITPQTSIIETLASLIQSGAMKDCYYIPMESEHSVLAACQGASASGVRTFTATSGQGLLYMHELLHWVSSTRLPIVMGVVNRAVASGWNIWMDQTDTVSQRDTGWMQIYVSNHQELYDHLFISYKLAEKALLPAMLIQDAFFLSHTMGVLEQESDEKIASFLPEKPNLPFAFDFENPKTLGGLSDDSNYMEFRHQIKEAFDESKNIIKDLYDEFENIFGRKYNLYETHHAEDAETLMILSGTAFETAFEAVDELRAQGHKVGTLKIRFLRPFFEEELRELCKDKKKIIILDRNYSFGSGGVFAKEVQSALYEYNIPVESVIAGLGGRDLTAQTIKQIFVSNKENPQTKERWEGEVYVH